MKLGLSLASFVRGLRWWEIKYRHKVTIPMRNKTKNLTVFLFLVAIFLGSWLIKWSVGHWYGWLVLPTAILLLEYLLECRQFKTYNPPLTSWLIKSKPKPVEPLEVAENEVKQTSNLIRSIADLKLRDFVKCCVYNSLELLGEGSEEERKEAFNDLISQFYKAKKDESILQRLQIIYQLEQIKARKIIIDALSEIMTVRYHEGTAKKLKELYPQFSFSNETILEDLKKVSVGEIANKRTFERLTVQLEKMDAAIGHDESSSPEDKYASFVKRLMDINKHEGVKYDMDMSVLEYAIAEARLTEYIEHLNSKNNGG